MHELEVGPLNIEAPGITYSYNAEVRKDGYFYIVGRHDKAPNHEMSLTPIPGEVHTWNGQVTYSTMRHLFTDPIEPKYHFYNLVGDVYGQKNISESGYWK